MRRIISVVLAGSLLALIGGCESLPRIAVPELPKFAFPDVAALFPDFRRMFPDFDRMMADLFGTPLDAPVPQQPPLVRPLFADRVIVLKSKRQLQLAQNGKVFESF